jgi:hypothetical protein
MNQIDCLGRMQISFQAMVFYALLRLKARNEDNLIIPANN